MDPVGVDDDQLEVMRREATQPGFRSEEARLDFERARRRQVAVWVFLVLLVCGWSVFVYQAGIRSAAQKEVEGSGGKSGQSKHGHGPGLEPIGAVDAKMKANCILPSSGDCHSPAVQMLKGVAQRYPDKVRVEFATMEQLGEKALTQQVGSYCAAVIINGKSDFDVAFEGSTRHVSLVGSAPSHYSLRDLLDCVTTVYTDLYGAPSEPLATLPEGELATGKLRDSAKGSEPALDFDLPKPAQLQLRQ